MKTFQIDQWSTRTDQPDVTAVKVRVLEEVAPGIVRAESFEFDVQGKHDGPGSIPALDAAVDTVLRGAGLI
jgi:hypothetical protein